MTKIFTALFILFSIGCQAQTLGDPNAIIYSIDIRVDDHLLAALVDRNRVELWDYRSKQLIKSFPLSSKGNALALGNGYVIIAFTNGVVEIYSTSSFEKIGFAKVTDDTLFDVKIIANQKLMVTDSKESIFVLDTIQQELSFRKLISTAKPITSFDFIQEKNTLMTSHGNNIISFWSIASGKKIAEQKMDAQRNVSLRSIPSQNRFIASFENGDAILYGFSGEDFSLREINRYFPGHWPVAVDYLAPLAVFGNYSGGIKIFTQMGTYKTDVHAMVNSIRIIPDELPQILLAVGTHGKGILILKALDMKLGK